MMEIRFLVAVTQAVLVPSKGITAREVMVLRGMSVCQHVEMGCGLGRLIIRDVWMIVGLLEVGGIAQEGRRFGRMSV